MTRLRAAFCATFACLLTFALIDNAVHAQAIENNRPYNPPGEISLAAMAEAVKELAAAVKSPGQLKFDFNVRPDGMVAIIAAILVFPFVLYLMPNRSGAAARPPS